MCALANVKPVAAQALRVLGSLENEVTEWAFGSWAPLTRFIFDHWGILSFIGSHQAARQNLVEGLP